MDKQLQAVQAVQAVRTVREFKSLVPHFFKKHLWKPSDVRTYSVYKGHLIVKRTSKIAVNDGSVFTAYVFRPDVTQRRLVDMGCNMMSIAHDTTLGGIKMKVDFVLKDEVGKKQMETQS